MAERLKVGESRKCERCNETVTVDFVSLMEAGYTNECPENPYTNGQSN